MSDFIYLASQSPRRSQLLDQIGVAHKLLLAGPDEDAESLEDVHGAEAPSRYVARVTGLKLDAALQRRKRQGLPAAPVLCADTTVCVGRDILGKPADQADAVRILQRLAGQSHRVLTAVAVQKANKRVSSVSESWVRFAPMSLAQIRAYVATGEPMGKAGAYGVQGSAAAHIEQIRGSYSGIMGLPLFETATLLRSIGVRC
ncbi:Maf family protein [Limnohabitans sp.]|uniref:Maf family protein n=1 Tax=Limnohabitans sp. TaxID=1907725 RepID=UPI002AFF4A83|nr:Maf family protein [Limnohabitans sp.]